MLANAGQLCLSVNATNTYNMPFNYMVWNWIYLCYITLICIYSNKLYSIFYCGILLHSSTQRRTQQEAAQHTNYNTRAHSRDLHMQ
jgi:hypothetical protein